MIDENEYNKIHNWLRGSYGLASRCENRKCPKQSTKYEWALKKDKEYEAKRENFKQLCCSCHRQYDIRHGNHNKYKHLRSVISLEKETYEKLRVVAFERRIKMSVLVSEFVATL